MKGGEMETRIMERSTESGGAEAPIREGDEFAILGGRTREDIAEALIADIGRIPIVPAALIRDVAESWCRPSKGGAGADAPADPGILKDADRLRGMGPKELAHVLRRLNAGAPAPSDAYRSVYTAALVDGLLHTMGEAVDMMSKMMLFPKDDPRQDLMDELVGSVDVTVARLNVLCAIALDEARGAFDGGAGIEEMNKEEEE